MQNVLTELLPRRVRLWLYLIVFVVLLILTAWQAADGEWGVAIVSILASLAPLLAAGNVTPEIEDHPTDPEGRPY